MGGDTVETGPGHAGGAGCRGGDALAAGPLSATRALWGESNASAAVVVCSYRTYTDTLAAIVNLIQWTAY